MTSIRDLAKQAKCKTEKQINRILDAEIEDAYASTRGYLNTKKPVFRLVLSAVPLVISGLCLFIWMRDIWFLGQGDAPRLLALSRAKTEFVIYTMMILGMPIYFSGWIRRFFELETKSFRLVRWAERLTYFTIAVLVFDHFTMGYSFLVLAYLAN